MAHNKFVYLGCFIFFLIYSTYPVVRPKNTPQQKISMPFNKTNLEKIGDDLIAAAKEFSQDRFKKVLTSIIKQYGRQKDALFTIFDRRDADGYNILHLFLLLNDLENLDYFFEQLEEVYAEDTESFFKYLMTRDTRMGMTIVSLAQEGFSIRTMAYLLMRLYELLKDEKEKFFQLIYTEDKAHGWHALVNAADGGDAATLMMLLTVAGSVLGVNSEEFKKFVNKTDKDGDSALDIARTRRDELLLEQFGAKRTPITVDTEYEQVKKIGLRLIEASNRSKRNIANFNKIVDEGVAFCAHNEQLGYYIFATQDSDGWSPVMHAASAGVYTYITKLIEGMKTCFKTSKEMKYHIFRLTDPQGRSPLHLVLFRKYFRMARLMFDYILEDPFDKSFVFSTINMSTNFNGFSPLTAGLYIITGNDTEGVVFLEYLLKRVADIFGKNSRYMYLLVTGRDYNDLPPLAYVISANIRKILRDYGATDFPAKKYIGKDDYHNILRMYADLSSQMSN